MRTINKLRRASLRAEAFGIKKKIPALTNLGSFIHTTITPPKIFKTGLIDKKNIPKTKQRRVYLAP